MSQKAIKRTDLGRYYRYDLFDNGHTRGGLDKSSLDKMCVSSKPFQQFEKPVCVCWWKMYLQVIVNVRTLLVGPLNLWGIVYMRFDQLTEVANL